MFKIDLKKRLVAYCATAAAIIALVFWFASTAVVTETGIRGDFSFIQITFGASITLGTFTGQYFSFSVMNFLVLLFLVIGILAACFGVLWSSKYNQWVRLGAAVWLIAVGILVFFSVSFLNASAFIPDGSLGLGWGAYIVAILTILSGLTLIIDRFALRNKL